MRFCNHHLSSAVQSAGTHANYAESIKRLPLWISGKNEPDWYSSMDGIFAFMPRAA
jgi:hypothetical protein